MSGINYYSRIRSLGYFVLVVVVMFMLLCTFGQTTYAEVVTATIAAGSEPDEMALNPVTNRIYVINYDSKSITVIDEASNTTRSIGLGYNPIKIVVDPVINKIYVLGYDTSYLMVIDGVTEQVVRLLNMGTYPYALAVNPVTNKVYVANRNSANVTVVNGIDLSTKTVTVGNSPSGVAVNPATNKIYVTNKSDGTVSIINGVADAVERIYTSGVGPEYIGINPVTNRVYVANMSAGTVSVFDQSVGTVATVNNTKGEIAVNPVTNKIYVLGSEFTSYDRIKVIDGATNTTETITVAYSPTSVAINPNTNKIYVASSGTNSLTIIDGTTNATQMLNIGAKGCDIAVNPITNKIYVTNMETNNVTVVDGADYITQSVTTPYLPQPIAIEENPATNKIYVASGSNQQILVIDEVTNTSQIVAVRGYPDEIAINPMTNKIYVLTEGGGGVTVIDGASNSTQFIDTGFFTTYSMAVNPVTNKIYAACSDKIVVIDGDTNAVRTIITPWTENNKHVHCIAVNIATNKIYAVNYDTGNLVVIDGVTDTPQTVALGVNTFPETVAINPVTNKIYVLCVNRIIIVDGANNNSTQVIPLWNNLREGTHTIGVNSEINRIYVPYDDKIIVINGADNTYQTIDTPGAYPFTAMVNPVTNKVYFPVSMGLIVLEGRSNTIQTVNTGIDSIGVIAINPINSKIYLPNYYDSSNICIVRESSSQDIPLAVSITPQAGVFNFTATGGFSPNPTNPGHIYYQIDTWNRDWLKLTPDGVSGYGLTSTLSPGIHTIYAFATDGQEAASVNRKGILTGKMGAYTFLALGPVKMTPESDSGEYNYDRITNITTPSFTGSAKPNALISIYLDNNTAPAAATVTDSSGVWQWTVESPISEGDHTIGAVDSATGISSLANNSFTIDTTPPGAPGIPVLNAGDDSGVSNTDHITNVNRPRFTGSGAETGWTWIGIYDGSEVIGKTPAYTNGGWNWTPANPLPDKSYAVSVAQSDRAGNISAPSPVLNVTIDTTKPGVSSIKRQSPLSTTKGPQVVYRVTFNEAVVNVDPLDFHVNCGGTATGYVASMTANSGTTMDVTVASVGGTGSLTLGLNYSTDITDLAGNAMPNGSFSDETFQIDNTGPAVKSIIRLTPSSPTNSTSVTYRVTFNEGVSGVDAGDFSLSYPSGTLSGTITGVTSNDPAIFDVTVNSISGSGTLRLDLKSSGTNITDTVGNLITGGYTSGDSYTIDMTKPYVTGINRLSPVDPITHLNSVMYQVTFSESVSGVDVSDFSLTCTSGEISGTIASVAASSGSTINVTVNSINGMGDLRLDLKSSAVITDIAGNLINGGYTNGQTYTIDPVPAVNTINRLDPVAQVTNATSVIYRVIFSETVSGVDKADFSLNSITGTATGVIDLVSPVDGATYDVTVTQIRGDGSLRLDLNSSGTGIKDVTNNPISAGFTAGQMYDIDNTPPTISNIFRSNPTNDVTKSTQVQFEVIFTENVTGVDISDFELTCTGTATGTIKSVSATSGNYTFVTVDGISGTGTLRLDLKDGTEIKDNAGNTAEGFQYGAIYTIDNAPPVVLSISRFNPAGPKTNSSSVIFRVIFDEDVIGVDKTDFVLNGTPATTTGTITAVSGTGNIYDVTVNAIAGEGLLRLDLNDSGTGITDMLGNQIKLGYTAGETYEIDTIKPTVSSIVCENPNNPVSNLDSLTYRVTFSEDVSGIDSGDFTLMVTGTAIGAISSVSGVSGLTYDVTINRISGNGTLRLDIRETNHIRDLAGNSCSEFSGGETYTIDMMVPAVISLNRKTPAGTTVDSLNGGVTYLISFSEPVKGVDISDFSLVKTGTAKGLISSVSSNNGIAWDVTVSGLSGNGTLRLDLKSSGTGITDTIGNLISGGFTGEVYTIRSAVPAPVFNLESRSYDELQNVTITCDLPGAIIRYTTNGTEPTTASPAVSSGGTIQINKTMTLKAKAWMTNWLTSPTTTASYTINKPAKPTFSLAGGMYATAQFTTISCVTPKAVIYYTIDNTDPSDPENPNRKKYITGVKIAFKAETTILRAIAYNSSLTTTSEPAEATYTITTVVPTPVITPSKTFKGSLNVSITCADTSATIYYTTNGNTPNTSSAQYSDTINITETTTIKAIAYKEGMIPSKVVSAVYTATVADPSFILAQTQTYTTEQKVTLQCDSPEAVIRYTTNGSIPSTSSPEVPGDGIPLDRNMTIMARAFKTGWVASGVVKGVYKVSFVAPPAFSLPEKSDSYTSPQTTTISCPTAGAIIKYTADGSEPTVTNGKIYKAGTKISILKGKTTLKAYAYKTGSTGMTFSSITERVYEVEAPVATPTFVLDPNQVYTEEKMITVQCATGDAVIRYTVNGKEPTSASPVIPASGILLNKNLTVKAKAYKSGWVTSTAATANYKTSFVATPVFALASGIYAGNQATTISCATANASIKYTTDGSDPVSVYGKAYKTGTKIPLYQGTTTIRAYAFKNGLTVTANTNEATYHIIGTAPVPVFKPASKSFTGSLTVDISCSNPLAEIRYTTDGSTPTPDSNLYSASQKPTVYKTTVIKARAFLDGWIPSNIVSAAYTSADKAANFVWQDLGAAFGNGAVNTTSKLRVYQGIPYIAFVDSSKLKATVWSYNSNEWGPLGGDTVSAGNASYPNLFNAGNKLYLSYEDVANGLKATVFKYDGGWSPVIAAGFSDHQISENSLFVYNNKPYLAFLDRINPDEDYASVMWQDGSSWKYIGSEGFSNAKIDLISLAVYKGKPYVIYKTAAGDVEVKYYNSTTGTNSSWADVGAISATGVNSEYAKICLDSTGIPYVIYNDNPGKMIIKKYSKGIWSALPSVFEEKAYYGDLFVDGATPYIAYFDSSANKIFVKKLSGGVWVTVGGAGIETGGPVASLSIFVESGIPYIGYMRNNSITVKRAK